MRCSVDCKYSFQKKRKKKLNHLNATFRELARDENSSDFTRPVSIPFHPQPCAKTPVHTTTDADDTCARCPDPHKCTQLPVCLHNFLLFSVSAYFYDAITCALRAVMHKQHNYGER